LLFSGFIALDLRNSFSYHIFTSPNYRILKKATVPANAKIGFVPFTINERAARNLTYQDARIL
jgi:hypothetical protein